jgi:RNA polymerase-binding transcription factor DksA
LTFFLKVQINTDHEHERRSLKSILEEDQENLLNLQEESRHRIDQQHLDEQRQLERNIEDRLRKLNEQVIFLFEKILSVFFLNLFL